MMYTIKKQDKENKKLNNLAERKEHIKSWKKNI